MTSPVEVEAPACCRGGVLRRLDAGMAKSCPIEQMKHHEANATKSDAALQCSQCLPPHKPQIQIYQKLSHETPPMTLLWLVMAQQAQMIMGHGTTENNLNT